MDPIPAVTGCNGPDPCAVADPMGESSDRPTHEQPRTMERKCSSLERQSMAREPVAAATGAVEAPDHEPQETVSHPVHDE